MTAHPRVSVITVNFNMAGELAGTLDSLLGQDYPNVEAVVIDGASSDGSREIVADYGPRLGYWVSEPDRSLYDAMNKGVAAATGDWVLFMNSGDRFAAPDVLSRIFATSHEDADVLYGHHVRHYAEQGIDRVVTAERPEVLPLRMHCSHQAILMRQELLSARPFDLALLVADYDSMLDAFVSGKRFKAVDCVIAVTTQGGRSDKQRLRALRERAALVRRNNLMTLRIALYYTRLRILAAVAQEAKKILPKNLVSAILRHRPIKGMG